MEAARMSERSIEVRGQGCLPANASGRAGLDHDRVNAEPRQLVVEDFNESFEGGFAGAVIGASQGREPGRLRN